MLAKLKNMGDAPRVVYDKRRIASTIKIGEEVQLDLHPKAVETLQQAQTKGDTLLISVGPQRIRVRRPGGVAASPQTKAQDVAASTQPRKPEDTQTPIEGLAIADGLEYHTLLTMVNRLVPGNKLPPRPTKLQMIDLLRKAAAQAGNPAETTPA